MDEITALFPQSEGFVIAGICQSLDYTVLQVNSDFANAVSAVQTKMQTTGYRFSIKQGGTLELVLKECPLFENASGQPYRKPKQ
jgi:hypothetical protein